MNRPEIKDGAIFIADAHYPHHGYDLLRLFHRIENGEVTPPQIFMMGDDFDLLIGASEHSHLPNKELIELIRKVSKKVEMHYLEGNHDFGLGSIFPYVKVYPIEQQPIYMKQGELRVGLSHGDKFAITKSYGIMTKIVRHSMLHKILMPAQSLIIDKINKKLKMKEICSKVENFDQKVTQIYKNYKMADMVIEGHFHQARVMGSYVSLPSLACHKQVGRARGEEIEFVDIKDL